MTGKRIMSHIHIHIYVYMYTHTYDIIYNIYVYTNIKFSPAKKKKTITQEEKYSEDKNRLFINEK